jgi:hypothetical protein
MLCKSALTSFSLDCGVQQLSDVVFFKIQVNVNKDRCSTVHIGAFHLPEGRGSYSASPQLEQPPTSAAMIAKIEKFERLGQIPRPR